MTGTKRGSVVVCGGDPAVLRWAAAEAERRDVALQPAVPGGGPSTGGTFGRFLRTVRGTAPALEVTGDTAALTALYPDAGLVVGAADDPGMRAVIAEAYCPVAVVPRAAAGEGPVVLGVAPWTGEKVIDLAFRSAAQRATGLQAVRAWHEPCADLGRLLPGHITRWDAAEQRVRRELTLALSAWRVAYPEVEVTPVVVDDRPGELLVALSHRAQLLVVGRSARGALLSRIAGSPVDRLTRQARCPLLIVPEDGPPRSLWLPSRPRRLTGLRR